MHSILEAPTGVRATVRVDVTERGLADSAMEFTRTAEPQVLCAEQSMSNPPKDDGEALTWVN